MKRLIVWVCLVPVITLLGYMFYVAEQIERQSLMDESQPADVIVVMGAAPSRASGVATPANRSAGTNTFRSMPMVARGSA